MTIPPAHPGFGYCGFACLCDFLDSGHSSSCAHVCKDAGSHERHSPKERKCSMCANSTEEPLHQSEYKKCCSGCGHHNMRSQNAARLTWIRSAICRSASCGADWSKNRPIYSPASSAAAASFGLLAAGFIMKPTP